MSRADQLHSYFKKVYIFSKLHILEGQGKEQSMKEKIKTFLCVLVLVCALPYIITKCFDRSGKESGTEGDMIRLPGTEAAAGETKGAANLEEYLIGVVAKQMPMSYEPEALKAQAVIARTNLLAAKEKGEELPEGVLRDELLKLWGKEDFGSNYQKLVSAVKDTEGVVLTCQGSYIYAAFHAVSAGRTRSAAEALSNDKLPWLDCVDSDSDIASQDYLKVIFLEKSDFVKRLTKAFPKLSLDAEKPLDSIAASARDGAGYVTELKNGEETVNGEEFRNALGLNSACFYMKEVEGKIRIVTKGLGHGLGLSQYGANEMAKKGMKYSEILSYYFKNIEISD